LLDGIIEEISFYAGEEGLQRKAVYEFPVERPSSWKLLLTKTKKGTRF